MGEGVRVVVRGNKKELDIATLCIKMKDQAL